MDVCGRACSVNLSGCPWSERGEPGKISRNLGSLKPPPHTYEALALITPTPLGIWDLALGARLHYSKGGGNNLRYEDSIYEIHRWYTYVRIGIPPWFGLRVRIPFQSHIGTCSCNCSCSHITIHISTKACIRNDIHVSIS